MAERVGERSPKGARPRRLATAKESRRGAGPKTNMSEEGLSATPPIGSYLGISPLCWMAFLIRPISSISIFTAIESNGSSTEKSRLPNM